MLKLAPCPPSPAEIDIRDGDEIASRGHERVVIHDGERLLGFIRHVIGVASPSDTALVDLGGHSYRLRTMLEAVQFVHRNEEDILRGTLPSSRCACC